MVRRQVERVRRACERLERDPASLRSNRLVGVTLTDKTVDVAVAKRRLLEEADGRTRQVMDAAGQYWRDILHRQWPNDVPPVYTFEDFFDVTEFHCVGSPEQVAEQITAGVSELGIGEVVVWPHGMLRSWEPPCVAAQADLVERFAIEVMPLLEVQ
jgi:alkanesulfonate monooxygenase SsuD/methylene tetrahydromethanopterin reductase-like flavin-dependent oxidoreductase (luciferase family)